MLKALNSCNDSYAEFISVNSHMSGSRVFIDLRLRFYDAMSYCEIRVFHQKISKKIHVEIAYSAVYLTISE